MIVGFDELLPGDVLLKVDSCNVTNKEPIVVERAAEGRDRLELVKPRFVTTEHILHRNFGREYLVERTTPFSGARKAVDDDDTIARLALAVPRMESSYDLASRATAPPRGRVHESKPVCGDVVLIPSGGFWRAAVVTDVGRKNVRVAYATPGGVARARGTFLRVMRPHVPMADAYVVTGESWAQQAING